MTAASAPPELDVQRALMKDLVVHQNVRQELVFTTVDKIKLCLIEHRNHLAGRTEWVAPLGLLISLVTTLVAATFQPVGLAPATWEALYILAAIGAFVWTAWLIARAIRAWRAGGLDALLDRITNRQDLPITSTFYSSYLQAVGKALAQFAEAGDAPAARGGHVTPSSRMEMRCARRGSRPCHTGAVERARTK